MELEFHKFLNSALNEMNGQLNALATSSPVDKDLLYSFSRQMGGPKHWSGRSGN